MKQQQKKGKRLTLPTLKPNLVTSNNMPYLHLTFKGAKLHPKHIGYKNTNFTASNIKGETEKLPDDICDDMNNLIPFHCVSNMLHYLCGLVPVKHFDRIGYMKRVAKIDDCARTAKIKIDSFISKKISKNGNDYFDFYGETTTMSKAHLLDSNLKFSETIPGYEEFPGCEIPGFYSYDYIKSLIGNVEIYNEVMSTLRKCITKIPLEQKIDHVTFLSELKKVKDTDMYKDSVSQLLLRYPFLPNILKANGGYLLLNIGRKVTTSNIISLGLRRLFNQKGIAKTLSLSGKMIIKIDEEIQALIEEGPMTATLLDGGLVTIGFDGVDSKVNAILDFENIGEYESGWEPVRE